MKWIVFAAASLFGLPAAHADVCAWNSQTAAKAAVDALPSGTDIWYFCQPCGDKAAEHEVVSKTSIAKADPNQDYYIVSVNGHEVDLAYVFTVSRAGGGPDNLGLRLTCSDDKSNFVELLPKEMMK